MNAETPILISVQNDTLLGIVHPGARNAKTGVVIVVGGPQYRVGSHRQFLLLARNLAAAGIPALRFDYRGMGDSDGDFTGFETIEDDIHAAIDAFMAAIPGLGSVVLWGLCDAASAIMFYARRDPRVAGLVLLNPWVRTEEGLARARIKHYYAARLFERELWAKLTTGDFDILGSIRELAANAAAALKPRSRGPEISASRIDDGAVSASLPDRMAAGLGAYAGPALLIISGRDLTAREFEDAAKSSPRWRRMLAAPRITRRDLADADHTFSRREWRDQIANWTREWLEGL